VQFSTLIVIIISNRAVFIIKMKSFSPILNPDLEQGKLMAVINSRKETFKNMSSVVRNRLKLARHLGHTYCVRKCKKMGIEILIIVTL